LFLQRLYLLADGRLRNTQLARREREAQVARRRTKAAQQIERQTRRALRFHQFVLCEPQDFIV
jgi:hypothetical protein